MSKYRYVRWHAENLFLKKTIIKSKISFWSGPISIFRHWLHSKSHFWKILTLHALTRAMIRPFSKSHIFSPLTPTIKYGIRWPVKILKKKSWFYGGILKIKKNSFSFESAAGNDHFFWNSDLFFWKQVCSFTCLLRIVGERGFFEDDFKKKDI